MYILYIYIYYIIYVGGEEVEEVEGKKEEEEEEKEKEGRRKRIYDVSDLFLVSATGWATVLQTKDIITKSDMVLIWTLILVPSLCTA